MNELQTQDEKYLKKIIAQNDTIINMLEELKNERGSRKDKTYEHLSNIARLKGTMMDDRDFIRDYLDERFERVYNIPETVGMVAGKYPDNILLITMNGHITCSKYGVIYDSFDCRDREVEYCWIVN